MLEDLKIIFEQQKLLMKALHPKELAIGYNPPLAPMNLNFRPHQDWMRMLAWYLTEEIVEAEDAADLPSLAAELSDCLHFAVEICIFSGLDHTCVESHFGMDSLDDVPPIPNLTNAIFSLGRAVNLLKLKPWKASAHSPVSHLAFQAHISKVLFHILKEIKYEKLDPLSIYRDKNFINHQRNANGY